MGRFNVVLTSNGFNNLSNRSEKIENLFRDIASGKRILLICNAANEKSANYVSRTDIKRNFENVGAALVDLIDLDRNNVEKISNYDVIYALGGQIQDLLESMQKTDFRGYLIKFLEKGIFIGESSGAIVLADDVKWYYDLKKGTKAKYDIILSSYKGMGITKRNVYPHYNTENEEMKKRIKVYEESNNVIITPLNDGEFILENVRLREVSKVSFDF